MLWAVGAPHSTAHAGPTAAPAPTAATAAATTAITAATTTPASANTAAAAAASSFRVMPSDGETGGVKAVGWMLRPCGSGVCERAHGGVEGDWARCGALQSIAATASCA